MSYEIIELELNKKYFVGYLNSFYKCKIITNKHNYLNISVLNNVITSKYVKFILDNNNNIQLVNL
ncbi:MAG: hypothetical protein ACRCZ1_05735 [Cetobacterium sp.]